MVGAAVTVTEAVTEAVREHTPRWPRRSRWAADIDGLVTRGASRWHWLVNQPQIADATQRLAHWSRRFDQRLQADVDELSDRGEELLAYAELVRWRTRRLAERALSTALHYLRARLAVPGLGGARTALAPPPTSRR
jgi:hypothetical protein